MVTYILELLDLMVIDRNGKTFLVGWQGKDWSSNSPLMYCM